MSIVVDWHPQRNHTILCTIQDAWTLDDFNLAHLQIISLGRRATDRVTLIIDLTHSPTAPRVGAAFVSRQVVSPFLTQIVIVKAQLNAPAVHHIRWLVKRLWADVPLSYAQTHDEALHRLAQPVTDGA